MTRLTSSTLETLCAHLAFLCIRTRSHNLRLSVSRLGVPKPLYRLTVSAAVHLFGARARRSHLRLNRRHCRRHRRCCCRGCPRRPSLLPPRCAATSAAPPLGRSPLRSSKSRRSAWRLGMVTMSACKPSSRQAPTAKRRAKCVNCRQSCPRRPYAVTAPTGSHCGPAHFPLRPEWNAT